jgi:hypothetical protein
MSTSQSFRIDVNDLASSSQLKALLQGKSKPIFDFGPEMTGYWNELVQKIPNGTSATFAVSENATWKTSGVGIGFTLSGTSKCQLKLVTSGAVLKYAPDLRSQPTAVLPGTAYPGSAYIVASLDFQISGGSTASGTVNGLGIKGNVKGSSDTSVVFCHRVSGSDRLGDAVRQTLEHFVFAFEPACAIDLNAGDIAQVNFTGSLGCGLDVSYGITNVGFAAPGVASVLDSLTKGNEEFTLPSGKVVIGADATVNYTHTDDFTAIVEKPDASNVSLYVMRGHKNEENEGLKVTAAVTITNKPAVVVDPKKLQQGVNSITGTGGEKTASCVEGLEQKLNGKLDDWLNSTIKQGASLGIEWDQQQAASVLFKYSINLTHADLVKSSWNAICGGDLQSAVSCGGIIPDAGSGIGNELSHSFTIGLHFFNLFAASNKSEYFNKTYVTVKDNGTLCYMFDIGKESDTDVNKASKKCGIHFIATVDETTADTVSGAEVDLELEISAAKDQKEAQRICDLVTYVSQSEDLNEARVAMKQFADTNASGSLDVVWVLAPSVYGSLSCSEYTGNEPPSTQQQDSDNWVEFRDASVSLLNLQWARTLTYDDWQRFNVLCVHGAGSTGTPDRRSTGNTANVTFASWQNINADPTLIRYFLLNSAEFMNFCDDLHRLAGVMSESHDSAKDITAYSALLMSLVQMIVKNDVSMDYSKPAIASLIRLLKPQSVTCKTR